MFTFCIGGIQSLSQSVSLPIDAHGKLWKGIPALLSHLAGLKLLACLTCVE